MITSHLILILGVTMPSFAKWSDDRHPPLRSVTVVGRGEAAARPDMALVQLGVVTQNKAAAQALDENNNAMTQLLKSLADHGVAEKDVQTTNFNVAPQYRQDDRGRHIPEIVGYQVTNNVRVKVRQLSRLGKILDDVVKVGANQIHGISFSVSEPAQYVDDARRKAVADARRTAELYAQSAGAKLGQVLLIQEHAMQPLRGDFVGLARAAAEAVPVATGEQEFHASVTITYSFE
jgi:uncharacterized protein YggE